MYINFNKLTSKGIPPKGLLFLQAVHQQKSEDLEDFVASLIEDDFMEEMLEQGIIHYIKGKKGDSEISKLRTTKKGRDLLLSIQKGEEWDENDEILCNWLLSIYKKRPNYVKGNSAEIKRRLNWFKYETGITGNELSVLLVSFIKDSYVDNPNDKRPFNEKFNEFKQENPRAQLSNKIENILWTPKDRFQRAYTLENSPLWGYYQEFESYIENEWSKIQKK